MNLGQIQGNSGLPLWIINLNVAGYIDRILPYIFGAAGIVLLFMIISSGYQMMTSKGDPKIFQVAQGKLTTSILGILIVFISFWVVSLLLRFFGISFTGERPNPFIK